MGRNIPRDHAAGADQGIFPDGDAAEQDRAGANGGAALDQGGNTIPVGFRLQLSIFIGCARIQVIGKNHVVTDEDILFQGHAFANETMAGNFTAMADARALLDFHKGADFHVVANFATVKVGKGKEPDIFAQLHIGGNEPIGMI
jgi:hypothetical protein